MRHGSQQPKWCVGLKVCQCDKNYLYKDMEVSYVADTETISITTGTHDVT